MRLRFLEPKANKNRLAEFTPTPTFEKMFLFYTKDRFAKQSDEPHSTINTKVGVGVQFRRTSYVRLRLP
jgi:hypothetical protein